MRLRTYLPWLFFVLPLAASVLFLRLYLISVSSRALSDFKNQNIVELSRGDSIALANRLNALSSNLAWSCIYATKDGETFFERERGSCLPGVFTYAAQLDSEVGSKISIRVIFELPTVLMISAVSFVAFLTTTLALLIFTTRKVAELKLQKEKELSDIATRIAHDIRAPLSALSVAAKLIELSGDQRELISSATSQIRTMADELLDEFAGSKSKQPEVCAVMPLAQLEDIIDDVFSQLAVHFNRNSDIELTKVLTANTNRYVKAEVNKLKRLLLNVVSNSFEAIEKKGKISIVLSESQQRIVLTISDNGIGITPEVLKLLARPGVTFGKKNGVGLGLYSAKKILDRWGGALKIESSYGIGTKIFIALEVASGN